MLHRTLAALVLLLPFMDMEAVRVADRSIVVPYVATCLVAVAVLINPAALNSALRVDRAFPLLLCWYVLVCVSSAVLFLHNQRQEMLASNATQLASIGLMIVHYFFISAALRAQPVRRLGRLADLFVIVGAAGAMLSFYQLGTVIFGWPYFEVWRTSNLYFKAHTLNWHGGGSWIAFPRAYGTAPEPTFWAGFLVLALAVALGRLGARWRWWYVAAAVVIASGLVTTFSRAAIPSLAVVVGLWIWFCARGHVPFLLTCGVIAAAVGATIWPAFLDESTLVVMNDISAIQRFTSQITGLRMMADYPFIGSGPGSIPFLVDNYLFVIEGRQHIGFSRFYSFFLLVLVSGGVAGMLLFTGFLLELVRPLHKALKDGDRERSSLALAALLACAGITVHWVGSPAYNMSYIWFCLALAGTVAYPVPPVVPPLQCSTSSSI